MSIASSSISSAVLYEGLVVCMVVRFSFGIYQFMEKMHVLEGRYGGLVGTKALGEENGLCLLYGYYCGFLFGFLSSFVSQWIL